MNMISVLVIILMVLMIIVGGDRGVVSFITLCANFFLVLLSILLIYWGVNALLVTFVSCLLISFITLFYHNGENAKTLSSFISVLIILLLLSIFAYMIGYASNLQGFSSEKHMEDEMSGLSTDINTNMSTIAVSVIIIGLIGAVLDVSIAVSSSVYEVYRNNKHLSRKELLLSGFHIGSDIIGTTANTLFFAFLAEFFMLLIRFKKEHDSLGDVLNSKAFSQEIIPIMFSGIGCILIIPITSVIISYVLVHKDKFRRFIQEDVIFEEDTTIK